MADLVRDGHEHGLGSLADGRTDRRRGESRRRRGCRPLELNGGKDQRCDDVDLLRQLTLVGTTGHHHTTASGITVLVVSEKAWEQQVFLLLQIPKARSKVGE